MICLLLVLVALVMMVPVFREYFVTGKVPRFPTLIACGFLTLAGIQSLFSGMILDVMAAKDRRDFEYRLNRISAQKRSLLEREGREGR